LQKFDCLLIVSIVDIDVGVYRYTELTSGSDVMLLLCGMGCTPSKQANSVADQGQAQVEDYQQLKLKEDGNRNGHTVNTNEGNKNETNNAGKKARKDSGLMQWNSEKKPKPQGKFTQSQADFFEMLDKKIEAGREYASEDEGAR